jgi:hypothetical protein
MDLSVSDLLILVDGGLVIGKLDNSMSLTKLGCKYNPEEIKSAAKRVQEAIGGMNVSLKRFRPAGATRNRRRETIPSEATPTSNPEETPST